MDYVFAPIIAEILRAKVSVFVELYRKRRELAEANEQLQLEIAERKRAQEQALHAERLAAIGQMVSGLAHESRNALQQIQACVEMLRRRIKAPDETSFVDGIQKSHDRVHHLLEEVRNYAAPIKLTCAVHDLADLWQGAWNQLASQWKDRDVRIHEEIGSLDLHCQLDAPSIGRLFRGVFENSLASCKDPVQIDVVCSPAECAGQAAIRVRIVDNGVGLERRAKTTPL